MRTDSRTTSRGIAAATVWLGAALLAARAPSAQATIRLDDAVVPVSQSVRLELDARRPDYRGRTTVVVRVQRRTDAFQFHARAMTITRIVLRRGDDSLTVRLDPEGEAGLRTARLDGAIDPGEATLEVDFEKPFNTQAVGLYRVVHGGRGYLFTQFEAIDARRAFPCWDEPKYKIPWQLTITVPIAHRAVTNTPVEREVIGATTRTLTFRRTPPMPSYLVAIAAGPLESVAIPGLSVPGRIWTVQGQKGLARLAARHAPAILAALEDYFGRPYPYAKLDFIAIPEYWPGAMENPGAVTFSDRILLVDADNASVAQRRSMVRTIAHELAHMWFGDLVTMAWWDDLWLNESFADWLGDRVSAGLYPDLGVLEASLRSVQRLMDGDARPSTVPVRNPVESLADLQDGLGLKYGKGKTILRMVEAWIGEDAFRRGVRDYIHEHAWGNTTAADLFDALGRAAGRDLAPVLAGFLDQPGYPLITVTPDDDGTLVVSQRRFRNCGVDVDSLAWVVPLRLKVFDGERATVRTLLLDGPRARVRPDGPVAWVLPQAHALGYYRWSIPPAMIRRIASDPMRHLDAAERSVFLADVGALLDACEIGGDVYLDVLEAMAGSTDPDVVQSVLDALGGVSSAFVTDALRPAFAAYVRHALEPALGAVGMDPRPGESPTVTALRPRLLRWLGDDGAHPAVRERCLAWARELVADPSALDPSLARVALSVAAIDGDVALFDAFLERFRGAKAPGVRSMFLAALGGFEDPALRERALALALSDEVRVTEMFTVVGGLARRESGQDRALAWLMENYDAIAAQLPEEMQAYMPYFVSGCSLERLERARSVFEAHAVPGTERTLAKVEEQIRDCAALREREGRRVAEYLARFLDSPSPGATGRGGP